MLHLVAIFGSILPTLLLPRITPQDLLASMVISRLTMVCTRPTQENEQHLDNSTRQVLAGATLGSMVVGFSSAVIASTLNAPGFYATMGLPMSPAQPGYSKTTSIISAANSIFYAGAFMGSCFIAWPAEKFGRVNAFRVTVLFHVIGCALQSGAMNQPMVCTELRPYFRRTRNDTSRSTVSHFSSDLGLRRGSRNGSDDDVLLGSQSPSETWSPGGPSWPDDRGWRVDCRMDCPGLFSLAEFELCLAIPDLAGLLDLPRTTLRHLLQYDIQRPLRSRSFT